MQTTLRINDQLYREAKAEAAREGISMTCFLEEALRKNLQKERQTATGTPHPFPVFVPKRSPALSDAKMRKIAAEEELRSDMRKLGI